MKQTETRAQKNQGNSNFFFRFLCSFLFISIHFSFILIHFHVIGPSKSTQFQRDLNGLYTEATLISTDLEGEGGEAGVMGGVGGERGGGGKFILCCTEEVEKGDGFFLFFFLLIPSLFFFLSFLFLFSFSVCYIFKFVLLLTSTSIKMCEFR